MLLNMSRPPSIPSRGGPPSMYQPYSTSYGEHLPSQEASASQSHPRLPSLRTLLEPELLDKPSDHPLRQVAPLATHNASLSYEASSPHLKRRHDFDSHAHIQFERNAAPTQMAYAHRPPPPPLHTEHQSTAPSTPGSALSTGSLDRQRHGSSQSLHDYAASHAFRQSSSASDSIVGLSSRSVHDEAEDSARPVRRRIDALSRAPVRASRCIAQREMPGEGLCYIYEDGTYCKAIIDGEPVNPSWGITKAGKPRKRLAQACLTCREKKIKCEPGYPKCHQCAKSQRVCRGGMNQPSQTSPHNRSIETSPSAPAAATTRVFASESISPSISSEKVDRIADLRESLRTADARHNIPSLKDRDALPHPSTGAKNVPIQAYDFNWRNSVNHPACHEPSASLYQDQLAWQWEQDPSEVDPTTTQHALDLYFAHTGRATYGMFPRKAFLSWVQSGRTKSQDDRMLLYSVLALGSLFSPDRNRRSLGKRFAAVATYATEKRFGKFSLQLCQSRLLLALYHFARGKSQEAWDFCGTGLRAISALKLNTEDGVKELADGASELEYGFDRPTFEECCRRTFWSGFLMDVSLDVTWLTTNVNLIQQQRYNGFFGGTLFVVSIEDAFVKLPCLEAAYEAGSPCDTPIFDFELFNRFAPRTPVFGHMAYLCLISSLWGDVLTFTGRAIRRPDTGYEQHYESFYTRTYERLEGWHAMLPSSLRYSTQNLERSIADGTVGTFMSLHALYHATIIRLNRQIRVSVMPVDKIIRNLEHAFKNASNFLSIMHTLALVNRQRRTDTTEHLFSTPFPGYALMLSVDVLSSAGTSSTLPDLIDMVGTAMSCIEELATFWASARAQQKAVLTRLRQLTDIAVQHKHGINHSHEERYWRIGDSLDIAFGKDDATYKADERELFQVVAQCTGR